MTTSSARPSVRRSTLVLALGLALVAGAGCASRRLHQTFTKKSVSDTQAFQDQEELKKTSGVKQVLIVQNLDGSATLELFLDEDTPLPGRQAAVDLGYAAVH